MENSSIRGRKAWAAAVLGLGITALSVVPASAQRPRDSRVPTYGAPVVRDLHFAIEAGNRSTPPFNIGPGERFRILPGQSLAIRTVAIPADRPGERLYPETRFYLVSGEGAISLRNPHQRMGTVEVLAGKNARSQVAVIGYEILNGVALDNVDPQGRLEVEIAGSGWAAVTDQTTSELVADLYRGILLREPDRGAQSFEDRIAREGYQGLVGAAQAIANSEESRKGVYGKGVCDPQRLLAMYKQLLGWNESQIPVAEWNHGLDLLDQRRFPELVTELLQHREFFTSRRLDPPADVRYMR